MAGFLDHNFAGKPAIARTESGKVYFLDVDIDSLTVIQSDTPWGETYEGTGNVRDWTDKDGKKYEHFDDAEQVFPFWACDALQRTVKASGQESGWIKLAYIRTESKAANRLNQIVDVSEASFAERE